MKNNTFDNKFREAMNQAEITPPEYLWSSISKRMETNSRRRIIKRRILQSVAMIVLFLTTGVSIWHIQDDRDSNTRVFLSINKTAPLSYSLPINTNLSAVPHLYSETKKQWLHQQNKVTSRSNDVLIGTYESNYQIIESEHTLNDVELKKQELIPLTNGQNLRLKKDYDYYLNAEKKNYPTKNHSKKIQDQSHKVIDYALECVITPAYSGSQYSSVIPNTRGHNYSDSDMKGGFNVGGGVKFVMNTNKRLSFQTGILYNKVTHSTVENNVYYPNKMQTLSTFNNTHNIIYSALGKIKSKSQAVVFRSEQLVPTSYTRQNSENSIEHLFSTIDIPLLVRYKIVDQKIDLHVLGGFSGSFIVKNKAYLNYNNIHEYLGETEDIRPFNLSANIGITLAYPLFKNVSILAEPAFKYYLQSFSQDNQILFKPYSFSFSTGIGVTF